jgi:hypothetical protein
LKDRVVLESRNELVLAETLCRMLAHLSSLRYALHKGASSESGALGRKYVLMYSRSSASLLNIKRVNTYLEREVVTTNVMFNDKIAKVVPSSLTFPG